jgi:hypothetical protein
MRGYFPFLFGGGFFVVFNEAAGNIPCLRPTAALKIKFNADSKKFAGIWARRSGVAVKYRV